MAVLRHVQVVQVPVSDQQAALDFYVGALGLAVVADVEMGPHGRWLQVAPDGAATTLALVRGDERTPAGSGAALVLESSDIEEDVAALSGRGVAFPDGVEDMPWARVARFTDPDGNLLVLQTASSRD